LGIGNGVDRALVEGLAKAGRGSAEFVQSNTEIEIKVMKLFKEAVVPSLSQLNIDWGCTVLQVPQPIPRITHGSRLVVFGLIEKDLVSEKIILSGINDAGNPLKWPIPVTERKGNTIHKMAAYSLITELQSSDSLVSKKSQILQLALKYQLPSIYTSFVATTSNDTASSDTLKFHHITLIKPPPPVLQPERRLAWADSDDLGCGAPSSGVGMEDFFFIPPEDEGDDVFFSNDVPEPEKDWDYEDEDIGLEFDLFDGGPPAPLSIKKSSFTSPSHPPVFKDLKTAVVSTQYFDGCWDSAGISQILESKAHSALSQAGHSDAKIWATALAIAILELKCQDTKTTWEIVAQKGRTFILKILFGIEKKDKDEILQMVSDLIEKAKKVLSTM